MSVDAWAGRFQTAAAAAGIHPLATTATTTVKSFTLSPLHRRFLLLLASRSVLVTSERALFRCTRESNPRPDQDPPDLRPALSPTISAKSW